MVYKIGSPGLLFCRFVWLWVLCWPSEKSNTFSDRCLGSNIEEGRSKVWDALWLAEFREPNNHLNANCASGTLLEATLRRCLCVFQLLQCFIPWSKLGLQCSYFASKYLHQLAQEMKTAKCKTSNIEHLLPLHAGVQVLLLQIQLFVAWMQVRRPAEFKHISKWRKQN